MVFIAITPLFSWGVFDNSISGDFTQNFDSVPWQKTFHAFGYLRFFAKADSLHFAQNRLKANYRTHPRVLSACAINIIVQYYECATSYS